MIGLILFILPEIGNRYYVMLLFHRSIKLVVIITYLLKKIVRCPAFAL